MTEGVRVTMHNYIYASWHARLRAFIIDMLITDFFVLLLIPGTFTITELLSEQRYLDTLNFLVGFNGLFLWLIPLIYMTLFIGFLGRTPGMMFMKIKLTDTEGKPLGYLKALLRTIVLFIVLLVAGLGLLPIFFTNKKQTVQDMLIRSIVIVKR